MRLQLAEKLKQISGGKILDVGAGNGESILTLIGFLKSYGVKILKIPTVLKDLKALRHYYLK